MTILVAVLAVICATTCGNRRQAKTDVAPVVDTNLQAQVAELATTVKKLREQLAEAQKPQPIVPTPKRAERQVVGPTTADGQVTTVVSVSGRAADLKVVGKAASDAAQGTGSGYVEVRTEPVPRNSTNQSTTYTDQVRRLRKEIRDTEVDIAYAREFYTNRKDLDTMGDNIRRLAEIKEKEEKLAELADRLKNLSQ
jgi:outer membrane murein-binding lipoprotein Lpp